MQILHYQKGKRFSPLELVTVMEAPGASYQVLDGRGAVYAAGPTQGDFTFTTAGALGWHIIQAIDAGGKVIDQLTFEVDARTSLEEQSGQYQRLLDMLYLTMVNDPEDKTIRFQNRHYYVFVPWLRDHVHVLKGMKYFSHHLKDGIDLYRDSQREDGMIFDNFHERKPPYPGPDHWSVRFDYGGFFRLFDDFSAEFTRIPVENDVEYLFLEGLYNTWKATGDDAWMASCIPAAKKALEYSITSPFRWSERWGLLKRGHTIDTWDFQNDEDCLSDIAGWPDPMAILPGKTRFGIMFGDNTGYAAGCSHLAEMLERLERFDEAEAYRRRGIKIMEQLNRVSWNGRFFVHHVPEDPATRRDLGVDETTQVSLSNAYSLNRPITHEQCKAIIQTYLDLKEHLPEGSPGEWYTIYPPYQKGYGGHNSLWQYMNASVTPIVAGELSHGAFQHGFEAYGVDILKRLAALGQQHGGVFHCSYTGAFPPPPERAFFPVDLTGLSKSKLPEGLAQELAATPLAGDGDSLAGIRFALPGTDVVGVGNTEGLPSEVVIPIHAKAASLYLLHTINRIGHGELAGTLILNYADGSHASRYILNDQAVLPWSHWEYLEPKGNARAVWRHNHPQHLNMQLVVYGLDNPYPEREIETVQLVRAEGQANWYLLGLTRSDQPVYFQPGPISFGIPNSWGAAAVVYALVEGLAGVVDQGTCFNQVTLSPRWAAAGVTEAQACIRYPASGGYISYRYHHQPSKKLIQLELTGSGDACTLRILLPQAATGVASARVNGSEVSFTLEPMESSLYAVITTELLPAGQIAMMYR